MKIAIGINSFKQIDDMEPRHIHCIESLKFVQKKYPNNVSLYNISDEKNPVDLDGFQNIYIKQNTKNDLKEYSHQIWDYDENKKKDFCDRVDKICFEIPLVSTIFNRLSDLEGYNYFLFLNNDCIVSDRLIKHILNTQKESYAVSRLHIFPLECLSDEIVGESYSVHGFDAFAVKTEIWKRYKKNFPSYVLGRFNWDTHYATLFKLLTECEFVNKHPICLFHEEHNSNSKVNDVYTEYNNILFKHSFIENQKWFQYVYSLLLKRTHYQGIKWYNPFPNEEEIENYHFKYDLMEKAYGK